MGSKVYRMEYPVIGLRVLIQTDIIQVFEMSESRFGHWLNLPGEYILTNSLITVNIFAASISNSFPKNEAIQFKVRPDFFSAEGPGLLFTADRRTGKAEAMVDLRTVQISDIFKKDVLECMVLFLVTANDREPLHASVFIRNETALLLCGKSGSGKTTLGYSLYRCGADILAESACYIESKESIRLWGDPTGFNFRPDASKLFPELTDFTKFQTSDEMTKIHVKLPLPDDSDRRRYIFKGNVIIVFPSRDGEKKCRIREVSHKDMLRRLTSNRESGFDLSKKFDHAVSNLPVKGSYVLETGSKPSETLKLLESLFD